MDWTGFEPATSTLQRPLFANKNYLFNLDIIIQIGQGIFDLILSNESRIRLIEKIGKIELN